MSKQPAPIDMSRAHPKPRPFHDSGTCGVCRGLSAPPIDEQAAHQAEVMRLANAKLQAYEQQEADHQAHQAEEARRDNAQAVFGIRPRTAAELLAEMPPAARVLFGEGEPSKADLDALRADRARFERELPARAAAAALRNRRVRILRAIQGLDGDAIDALRELREQLADLDREAAAAGQPAEAAGALADALDPSPAAAPVASHEPAAPPPKRDPALALLLGSE